MKQIRALVQQDRPIADVMTLLEDSRSQLGRNHREGKELSSRVDHVFSFPNVISD
jgi:hypothetical protein